LLKQLDTLPGDGANAEPWFSLWSSLAHQGDVYSASFAAVPHIVHALSINPVQASECYFQFPAWVEICRNNTSSRVPDDLRDAYESALAQLPALVAAAAKNEWSEGFTSSVLAAIAASKGQYAVAETILELNAQVAGEFMEWFYER
jgi:hypothetical protein